MISMRFYLTLRDGSGEVTYKTFTAKRKRLSLRLMGETYSEADLRVVYFKDGEKIGHNHGIYRSRSEALAAWEAFNDPDIVL